MENAVNKRIIELINYFNISGNEFAKRIGIPQTTFSNIINRDSDIKASIIEAIHTQFGDISLDWLLTGKGTMLKSATPAIEKNDSSINFTHPNGDSRAEIELEFLRKENETLKASLSQAIADKDRVMSMLEKALSR